MPSRRISKRASSRPAATSSRRIAPGAVPRSRRMPLSITSPAPTSAENRPGPVDDHQRNVGQHRAHRQRAPGRARRLVGRLARVGQRQHDRAVGQRVQARRRARATSSSSSARAGAAAPPAGLSSLDGGSGAVSPRQRRSRRRRRPGDHDARDALLARRSARAGAAAARSPVRHVQVAERRPAHPARRRPRARPASRAPGSLASMRATTSSSAARQAGHDLAQRAARPRAGSWPAAPVASSASNTGRPVRHWNSTQPSENTSARA